MTWAQWAQTRPRAHCRAGQRPQRRRWGEMVGRNIRGNGPGSRGFPRNSSDNHQKVLAALVQSIPSKYKVEYRLHEISEWTIEADMLIGTSDVVDELLCESTYQFRVSAYGSGATYTEVWSEPSAVASQDTGTCESRGSSAPKSPDQRKGGQP